MTNRRSTTAMIAARRRDAKAKEKAVVDAISALTRQRQPLTVTSVAARAGVSRSYLSRHPTLGPRIRQAAGNPPLHAAPASHVPTSIEATLRHHIRALKTGHQQELARLRDQVRTLQRENARLRGELITTNRAQPCQESPGGQDGPLRVTDTTCAADTRR